MKERIVCVEWDDASFDSGYYDKQDPERYSPLNTKTVGMIVKSSAKEIILAVDSWNNKGKETEYRHITTIPKKMIIKIVELKGG